MVVMEIFSNYGSWSCRRCRRRRCVLDRFYFLIFFLFKEKNGEIRERDLDEERVFFSSSLLILSHVSKRKIFLGLLLLSNFYIIETSVKNRKNN